MPISKTVPTTADLTPHSCPGSVAFDAVLSYVTAPEQYVVGAPNEQTAADNRAYQDLVTNANNQLGPEMLPFLFAIIQAAGAVVCPSGSCGACESKPDYKPDMPIDNAHNTEVRKGEPAVAGHPAIEALAAITYSRDFVVHVTVGCACKVKPAGTTPGTRPPLPPVTPGAG